jgi:chromosomal replication initiator protein DnaA
MGLFDRLFKKKSKPTIRVTTVRNIRSAPAQSQTSTDQLQSMQTSQVVGQTGVTVKMPPGARKQYAGLGDGPKQRRTIPELGRNLDPKAKRILDESLAKIQPGAPGDVAGMKKRKKVKKATRPPRPPRAPGQPRTPAGTVGTAEPPMAIKPIVKKPIGVTAGTAPKTQLFEDTMGEEELFKKLAQWDKDLKQKVVPKKPKAVSTGTGAEIAVAEEVPAAGPGQTTDLDQREKELQKYEAKLRVKERKIKKMEEMNKIFTQLEDTELEQFSPEAMGAELPADDGSGVAVSAAPAAAAEIPGEAGIQVDQEFEELVQPLKTLTFTNFIVGPSNRFAHDVSLSVAKTPADAYNPLFVYSQVGLGKTHLLCAIGNYIKSKDPEARIVYASSEKFTNELLDYLRLGEMERFRTKYRNVDVLLIDDIQFIGGQEGTQEEFFHTFNALYNAHKQIVITSDRPPKNIAHLKDRLRSRFEGGLIVNIKPPDLGTRTMILHEKAEKDGIYIPDEIINYIAAKVKSNVRTLIGVLTRVVAHSSLTDRELDTGLVDEVLHDVLDESLEL